MYNHEYFWVPIDGLMFPSAVDFWLGSMNESPFGRQITKISRHEHNKR